VQTALALCCVDTCTLPFAATESNWIDIILRHKVQLNYTQQFGPFLAENALLLLYKYKQVLAIYV
jgi:hypothetical protein